MSGELVARLRNEAEHFRALYGIDDPKVVHPANNLCHLLTEAAEEIERLKLALDEYQNK